MAELYKIVLQEAWHSQTAYLLDDKKQLLKQIKKLEDKLSYIRDLLSSKQIEPEDFREMKSDYSGKVEKLDYVYETANIEKKREVISSMFPEKLHFENSSLRTGRVNEAVKYIYMIDSNLGGNKKGQAKNKFDLSCKVALAGQITNLFLMDLRKLAALTDE